MKHTRLLPVFFFVWIGSLLISCDKEDEPRLTLSESELQFDGAEGQITVDLFSNVNWHLSGIPDWCTISPTEGTGNAVLKITATANEDTKARESTLQVTTENVARELVIRQQTKEATALTVSTSILHFINQSCERTVDIETDGVWTVSGLPDWCTVDQAEGVGNATLTVYASSNETDREREAKFTVLAGTASEKIMVRQVYLSALVNGTTLDILTPGSLIYFLPYADELQGTTRLTITGRMNVRDIQQIDLYNCLSAVTSIDLRAVQIEKSKYASEEYVYEDNEFTGFAGFKRLQSIILPESISKIGDFAFQNCIGLTTLIIPENVTTVEIMAFDGCENLESIYFPHRLNYLGEAVFFQCEKLSAIHIANPTPPELHADALSYFNSSTCTLYVPKGSKAVYEAKGWNLFKEIREE